MRVALSSLSPPPSSLLRFNFMLSQHTGSGTTIRLHYATELSMGWVDPRVGLGWVGSEMGRKFVLLVDWIGSWV